MDEPKQAEETRLMNHKWLGPSCNSTSTLEVSIVLCIRFHEVCLSNDVAKNLPPIRISRRRQRMSFAFTSNAEKWLIIRKSFKENALVLPAQEKAECVCCTMQRMLQIYKSNEDITRVRELKANNGTFDLSSVKFKKLPAHQV